MTGTSANPEFLCPLRDRAGTGPVYMAAASVRPGKRQQHLRAQRTRPGRLRVRFRDRSVRDKLLANPVYATMKDRNVREGRVPDLVRRGRKGRHDESHVASDGVGALTSDGTSRVRGEAGRTKAERNER